MIRRYIVTTGMACALTASVAFAQTTEPEPEPEPTPPTVQEIVQGAIADLQEQGYTNIEVEVSRRGIKVEGKTLGSEAELIYDRDGNLRKSEVTEGRIEKETTYDKDGNVIKTEKSLKRRGDDDDRRSGRDDNDDRDDDRDDRDDDRDDRDDDRDDRDDDRDDRDDRGGRDRD